MRSDIPDMFLEVMAEKFKMLSDPSRLRIIKSLMPEERNVTAIVRETGLTQANVSKHLRLLTDRELVSRKKVGLNVFYSLADPVIERICRLVCETLLKDSQREKRSKRSAR